MPLGCSAIPKTPNSPEGDLLVALGNPVAREIADLLLDVGTAEPGDIATHVQKKFEIGQSIVSDRIKDLCHLRVCERRHDGTVGLTDPSEVERIIQAARRLVRNVFGEISRIAAADHASRARRTNKRARAPDLGPATAMDAPAEHVELIDDAAARVDWEHSAAKQPPDPPDAILRRREPRTKPPGWPAVTWVSGRDHSRPQDLIDDPARYIAAPARLLILNADWVGFDEIITACAADHTDRFDVEFLRYTIDGELRPRVEAVVAAAIEAAERSSPRERRLDEGALRSVVEDALPWIEPKIRQVLQDVLAHPGAPAQDHR